MDAKVYIKLSPQEKLVKAIFGTYADDIKILDKVDNITLKKTIDFLLATLSERESLVLRMRFGFDNKEAAVKTLEDVGKVFDITRERVRQIEGKALRRLRHWTRSRVLKPYLEFMEKPAKEEKPILKKIEQILRKVRDNGWLLGKFSVATYPPGNSYLSQIHQLFESEMQQQTEEIFKEIPKVFAGTLSLQELKDKFTKPKNIPERMDRR